jgi:hypothetical protein
VIQRCPRVTHGRVGYFFDRSRARRQYERTCNREGCNGTLKEQHAIRRYSCRSQFQSAEWNSWHTRSQSREAVFWELGRSPSEEQRPQHSRSSPPRRLWPPCRWARKPAKLQLQPPVELRLQGRSQSIRHVAHPVESLNSACHGDACEENSVTGRTAISPVSQRKTILLTLAH